MRGAHHPAFLVVVSLLAVALASGCGSSGTDSSGEGSTKTAAPPGAVVSVCSEAPAGAGVLRVSGVDCATGRDIVTAWAAKGVCTTPADTSRTSCTVGEYRCLGATTERGLAVNCARPGRSISFLVKRG